MKAIGFFVSDAQTGAESLRDIEIPKPAPAGRDLLVKIEAVSINPVDVKTRSRVPRPGARAMSSDPFELVQQAVQSGGPEAGSTKPPNA